MDKFCKQLGRSLSLSLIGVVITASAFSTDISVVTPPLDVDPSKFLPAELMNGKTHHVTPEAVNDGYTNTYTLETEWGELIAVSDYRLRVRIQETVALKLLDDMSQTDVFGDAVAEGAEASVDTAVDLVTNPVDTASEAAEGMAKWFGNVADSVASDDPHQEGSVSAAVGWAATKRAFAVELGVDPYTDWEPLQKSLASVSRAAFAGGLTASMAIDTVAEGTVLQTPVTVVSLTDTSRSALIDNPPEGLTKINRAQLSELGLSENVIEPFLNNYFYSPLEKLQLIEALTRMKGTEGLDIYLARATSAPDKIVARYMHQRAMMMAKYHETIAATSIVQMKDAPMQKTIDGRIIGVFPLDFVPWTQDLAVISDALSAEVDQQPNVPGKELWFEGVVSQDARNGMEARGWVVKENVKLLFADS